MAKKSDQRLRRALQASLFGSTLEFYDYIIFGLAAALVFPASGHANLPVGGHVRPC